ncbi:MAG: hypothetical protein ACI8P0_004048 [Planctomycetaceae bacterium]|jgi:hypothetical protein
MTIARVLSFRMLSVGLVLAALATISEAGKPAIPAQKAVEGLPVVPLFEMIKAEQVDVKLVQKDEAIGNLLVENKSGKPLNVQMPEAFVGVHVLNQGIFDIFDNQSGQGQDSGQSQGGQSTGGGASNSSQSGGTIFSVPPGKIVRIPVKTVCLEHGRPTPASRMEYRIFPVEQFSKDPALFELLTTVASGKTHQKVAQAAAWHMASDKSWKQLAAMKFRRLGGLPDIPEFTQNQLTAARKLAEKSQMLAEKKSKSKDSSPVAESVVARREVSAR